MNAKKLTNLLYSFEAPGTVYKRLKKLTSFNNTILNKRTQKTLASWMFRILCLFDFQKVHCGKAPEALTQCLYGCIRYCLVWVKQLIWHQFWLLTFWMFGESFSYFGACVIAGFDMNWLTNLKQTWTSDIYRSNVCFYLSNLFRKL